MSNNILLMGLEGECERWLINNYVYILLRLLNTLYKRYRLGSLL